jgi:uncharacterized phage protein gp47/JayE
MPELLTRLDLHGVGRQYMVAHARRIEPTMVDVDGSDANLFVGSQSYMGHAVVRQLGERVCALLLDGCDGEDLDRYVHDNSYGLVVRKGAAAAVVPVTISRPTAVGGIGTVAVGTTVLAGDGAEYVTLQDAAFGVATLSVIVDARAKQAGHAYQVGRNQLTRFGQGAVLFDSTLLVTNPEPAAGGEDVEQDEVLRRRFRQFWASFAKGTLGAIETGALSVPGVTSAQAFEYIDNGIAARVVQLCISDSSGVGNTALATLVLVALEEWRAAGIQVVILSSVPQIVSLSLVVSFIGNVDTVALKSQVRTAVVGYVNGLGVNQPLLRNDLGAVLARFRASGVLPTEGTVVSPVGDLYPTSGYTLRTRIENVVVN